MSISIFTTPASCWRPPIAGQIKASPPQTAQRQETWEDFAQESRWPEAVLLFLKSSECGRILLWRMINGIVAESLPANRRATRRTAKEVLKATMQLVREGLVLRHRRKWVALIDIGREMVPLAELASAHVGPHQRSLRKVHENRLGSESSEPWLFDFFEPCTSDSSDVASLSAPAISQVNYYSIMNRVLAILAIVAELMLAALPIGAAYESSGDIGPERLPEWPSWPPGMVGLVNFTNRVHGYLTNAEEFFFFTGNTADFQKFLGKYSTVTGIVSHRLIIHPGRWITRSPWGEEPIKTCDWELYACPARWLRATGKIEADRAGYILEVHLWKGGAVALGQLKIPENVRRVDNSGRGGPAAQYANVWPFTLDRVQALEEVLQAHEDRGSYETPRGARLMITWWYRESDPRIASWCVVDRDGQILNSVVNFHAGGSGTGPKQISEASLAALTDALDKLPPEPATRPPGGRWLVVSCTKGGQWTTLIYDRANIPKQLQAVAGQLLAALGLAEAQIPTWLSMANAKTTMNVNEQVKDLALSPDGKTLASASEYDAVKLWKASDGSEIRTIQIEPHSGLRSVGFSPDGTTLVSATVSSIMLSDVVTGMTKLKFWPTTIAISARYGRDNKTLLIEGNPPVVWDLAAG